MIFPSYCTLCNKILLNDELGICKNCTDKLDHISGNICYRCGQSIEYKGLCPDCQNSPEPRFWSKRRSLYNYNDAMARLVHEFKYNKNMDLLKYFSIKICEGYNKYFEENKIDEVIPVPISKQRKKERGYNQSVKLLKKIERKIKSNILIRTRDTKPQSSFKNDKKRVKNIKNAFKVIKDISGKNLLIVDDILTTGATLNEISRTLYKANANKIFHLTLIRAR
ncbi:MAG: ComF family protein [Candidatus Mcinerneyibacterium aminivorans]|uniref:ComF family protein n=1 Tax=Candidatus Mcinerneyibacterium aminivorans TaxID=2703815 RepID=A0A5D0MGY5_9BACT|nr:MAG: ComF family protein [Candidatus Mcinerneyibacterium aminivorans]